MFGCLVAGRLVSAARAAGGALNPLGAGVELPQGRPAGLALLLAGFRPGLGPGRGDLAILVTPARRLGWLLPLIPRGSCTVEPRCREAVTVPSVHEEARAPQRQAGSLKEAF